MNSPSKISVASLRQVKKGLNLSKAHKGCFTVSAYNLNTENNISQNAKCQRSDPYNFRRWLPHTDFFLDNEPGSNVALTESTATHLTLHGGAMMKRGNDAWHEEHTRLSHHTQMHDFRHRQKFKGQCWNQGLAHQKPSPNDQRKIMKKNKKKNATGKDKVQKSQNLVKTHQRTKSWKHFTWEEDTQRQVKHPRGRAGSDWPETNSSK